MRHDPVTSRKRLLSALRLFIPAVLAAVLAQPGLTQEAGAQNLREALLVLASKAPPAWETLEDASGLALTPADGYESYTTGKQAAVVLDGFGDVTLPDGNVGAEAGTRIGNEGEANVLFAGTPDSVRVAVVSKFYPRSDYFEVLADQILPADILVRRDGDCSPDAPVSQTEPTLYWLMLEGADIPLSVSGRMEEDGRNGPGTTIFEVRRGGPFVEMPVC